MKNKTRLEYVDQFRKINTLDKIPPLQSDFLDLFQQKKQQSNKFIRVGKQPFLLQSQLNSNIQALLNNKQIKLFVDDSQKIVTFNFHQTNNLIDQQLNRYTNLSQSLSKGLGQKQYSFKFYYKSAGPPQKIAKQSTDNNAVKTQLNVNNPTGSKYDQQIQSSHHQLMSRGKYNFYQINKKLIQTDSIKFQDQKLKVKAIDQIFKTFDKFKTLKQIRSMNQFQQSMKNYKYSLQQVSNNKINKILMKKFCYNSICHKNPEIQVNYLRDLGLPSRNIKQFLKINYQTQEGDEVHESLQLLGEIMSNYIINESKDETNLLHLLRPSQLSINKNKVNFFDIMNISTGRLTHSNINLCIRHEKVTRAQLQKAIKKLQRYHKLQRQDGKAMFDVEVQAMQNVDLNSNQQQNNQKKKNMNAHQITKLQIITQISQIRKQWRSIHLKISQPNNINEEKQVNNFKIKPKQMYHQIQMKMQMLLLTLYDMITDKMDVKYPMHQLHMHFDQIQNIVDDQGFDRRKILWFIMDCYQQINIHKKTNVSLRDVVLSKKQDQPTKTKFLGNKNKGTDKMNTQKLYEKKDQKKANKYKESQTIRNSVSPIKQSSNFNPATQRKPKAKSPLNQNKTPIKQQNRDLSKTPTKNNNKYPLGNTTKNQLPYQKNTFNTSKTPNKIDSRSKTPTKRLNL